MMTFSPIIFGNGIAGHAFLVRTRVTQQALFENGPQVQRDITGFKDRIEKVGSADALLDDRTLLRVALGAVGLDDDINNRAFLKKALESDLTDSTSFANRLADKRYLALAKTFDFANPNGPGLGPIQDENSVAARLRDIPDPRVLLADTQLLRATLASVGLEKDVGNTYFLQRVLESDVTDPDSFANRLSDPRYLELATAFEFAAKSASENSIYGFASRFVGTVENVTDTDSLFGAPDLLHATLKLFGLEADINRTGFLTSVLASDLSDPASFANQQDDKRYAAFSNVFGFGSPAPLPAGEQTKLQKYVALVVGQTEKPNTTSAFMGNFKLLLATSEFFGVSQGQESTQRLGKVIGSDRNDPFSAYNIISDKRFTALADALAFAPEQTGRVFPAGFAEGIARNYVERQFEIRIGESDPDLRISLSLDRDLKDAVAGGVSNDSRWFAVLASPPLRKAFEAAFQLPASFGSLDIDRQLVDFKARAKVTFGTSQLADLSTPENISAIRDRFLLQQSVVGTVNTSGASTASVILASLI